MNSYVSKFTNRTNTANQFITPDVRRAITATGYVSGSAQHLEAGEYVSPRTAAPRAA
ncbi:MAG: hypothetical protein LH475_14110 [Cryobacterium sp.]|uniref:hypothetical protein n=1 Tax=unclassified Cryobacterium TaxID=2649013 RepID=UPI0018C94377|nr:MULTISPECIES: hypothetical protein [unclassified Cryobacterium]MCY7405735.1 hypothetical protein [Cryobacterium sp.]MEC5155163.1 hypothetical protein [Cryobacterium sp. CAN_C3]